MFGFISQNFTHPAPHYIQKVYTTPAQQNDMKASMEFSTTPYLVRIIPLIHEFMNIIKSDLMMCYLYFHFAIPHFLIIIFYPINREMLKLNKALPLRDNQQNK